MPAATGPSESSFTRQAVRLALSEDRVHCGGVLDRGAQCGHSPRPGDQSYLASMDMGGATRVFGGRCSTAMNLVKPDRYQLLDQVVRQGLVDREPQGALGHRVAAKVVAELLED